MVCLYWRFTYDRCEPMLICAIVAFRSPSYLQASHPPAPAANIQSKMRGTSEDRELTKVFASAFGFELAYDSVTDRIWDTINKGRQWKDIRARYIEAGDGDDE
ncbi:hypothetical protein CJF32_00008819 [Rutstroemia sp. NJR-2017a WRK4]|nr:hypothetical protein CJF32_00008819 [Rutstroemia sp. NJR-2017a WRK4]